MRVRPRKTDRPPPNVLGKSRRKDMLLGPLADGPMTTNQMCGALEWPAGTAAPLVRELLRAGAVLREERKTHSSREWVYRQKKWDPDAYLRSRLSAELMPIKARSARAKGNKLEKQVVALLEGADIRARRQPGSGVCMDFPHDLEFHINGDKLIGECKKRAALPKVFDGWLGGADVLFMAADREPPSRVNMTFDSLLRMAKAANGDSEGGNGR